MKSKVELSLFNKLIRDDLLPHFPRGMYAEQREDRSLIFLSPSPKHIGSQVAIAHVVVSLEPELESALATADEKGRAEMLVILVNNLETQVRARYHPLSQSIRPLHVVGSIQIFST